MIAVGDVVLSFDGTIRSPKHKRWVCVSDDGWFLRINSKPYFPPHILILASDNVGCLDHDSYVELRGVLDLDLQALDADMQRGDARVLGRIGRQTAALLINAVNTAATLNQSEKDRIVQFLTTLI